MISLFRSRNMPRVKLQTLTGSIILPLTDSGGEALSSISSISDLVILSKTSGEEAGSRLESIGGNVAVTEFAGMKGTTIIVENLFFNMPARKKFLKSKQTELRNIRETIIKMALPAYKTSFTLDVDGKREISLAAVKNCDERIQQVFGKTILQSLYIEELTDLKVNLKGYLSKPDFHERFKEYAVSLY